ncbi:BREX-1 system adenine-specific DNA-methyltransferase PglX [Alkalimarinus alittae]|uniref:site-specific DNA-methyltransferase (adenine-specific) n=1 Tax=Alkalimarinus alittae TaxID=2961619 RepID=A0ABY6MX99_9ALTE|nr:BREX-1 system adenine-specific DNA-methyltransferase PglX [Alkalimarinus alittae]UZE94435.1 BREX-1 system adenine-specific DNA-methyltransferase PglX [Alkalimarinus alittae]
MDTANLKKFAQTARQDLIEQVGSKLAFVLKPESPARREYPGVVNELEKAMAVQGKAGLIEQVAYTWFNRFCALRFMDVNGYNRVGVVSPSEGQVQPEILAEAKSGVIDDTQINTRTVEQIRGLLNGTISSQDAQSEAYRLLIVGSCNALYGRMPYLFERIQDFTELLMPDDLLSENSILAKMRGVMTAESCQDVEVIGWLYQFYISEKKDQVFAGLKKNQKITAENIPAATQLFTPHWIVRYLVENSLGRLWMLNRPNSKLTEQMEYYIAPEEPESDFLKISSPEELKIADPAAGSGHMLTYAFDLLYAIYEEEGYDPNDIPSLILNNNLYGIEIDERAGALATFALEMKAAEKLGRRRFFRMDAKPNVCVLEDVSFSESEVDDVISIVGKDLYTADLRETLTQFEQAKNFGSLIVPKLKDPAETARLIEAKDFSGDLLLSEVHARLVKLLRMAEYLSPKYHVVVANPPYMGGKGMNGVLAKWLKDNYPDVKSDLFSAFIVRNTRLTLPSGQLGFMTPFVWMFISSYEKLRGFILKQKTLTSLIQLEYSGFDGATVPICTFTMQNSHMPTFRGGYVKLSDFKGAKNQAPKALEAIQNPDCGWFYRASAEDFGMIPGSPTGYWLSDASIINFEKKKSLGDVCEPKSGMSSCNSELFLRQWFEVSLNGVFKDCSGHEESQDSGLKWFPYNKGGGNRRWHGYNQTVINWHNNGSEIKRFVVNNPKDPNTTHWSRRLFNLEYFFEPGLTWSAVTSSRFSCRGVDKGVIPGTGSKSIYNLPKDVDQGRLLSFLNSKVVDEYLTVFSPTLNFEAGDVAKVPIPTSGPVGCHAVLSKISKSDWDSHETSWNFSAAPLLSPDHRGEILKCTYECLRSCWQGMTDKMYILEEENNRIFIDAYGLQDELTPEVSIEDITLTCNPAYRYGIKGTEDEREARLMADTMAEFLSYAVGCMFGRYSLDEPGLILANQGETLADYLARIPEPTFMPDDDNVIPMIDFEGDWFEDDISERFKQFLRVTFGDEHYTENVAFIEEALGKSIQRYFVKDFYKDHVQRYKKRPIYWLFSSSKGTFNALIYMHRYTPSTVSVVLNEYLREFRTKLEARKANYEHVSISASASQKEKTQALKMITKLDKAIDEVNDYEREVLYPLAGQNISIDLDDGVKHNYPLFGTALKKITGLS